MRRILFGLLSLLALSAIGLAAAVYFRVGLLELALRQGLAYAGFPEPEFRISAVTLSHAEIVDLRLGPDLRSARLRIEYRPGALAGGRLDRLDVDRLRLDLTAPHGQAIDRLVALFGSDRESASAGFTLPSVELRDSEVIWPTPLGPVRTTIDGRIEASENEALRGRFEVVAQAEVGRLQGRATIERASDGSLRAQVSVQRGDLAFERASLAGLSLETDVGVDAAGALRVTGEARLAALHLGDDNVGGAQAALRLANAGLELAVVGDALAVPFELAVKGALDLEQRRLQLERLVLTALPDHRSRLLPALGLPEFDSGTARLYLAGGGVLLPLDSLPSTMAQWRALLTNSGLRGTALLTAEAWSLRDRVDGLALVGGVDFAADEGVLAVRLPAPALIEVARLSPAAMTALGLPAELHALLENGLAIELENGPEAALRLDLLDGASPRATVRGALQAVANSGARLDLAASASLEAELWPEWRLARLEVEKLNGQARDVELLGQMVRQLAVDTRLRRTEAAWSGTGTLAMTLDTPSLQPLTAKSIMLDLPLDYDLDAEQVSLRLKAPGRLDVQGMRLSDILERPADMRLRLKPGPRPLLTAALSPPFGYRSSLSAGSEQPLDLRLGSGGEVVPFRLGPFALELSATGSGQQNLRLTAEASASELEAPSWQLRAETVSLSLRLDESAPTGAASYRVARLLSLDPNLPLPPFALAGEATMKDGTVTFDLSLVEENGLLKLLGAGRYALDSGRLDGKAALTPTDLAPLLPQIQKQFPAAALTALRGRLAARADLSWLDGRLDGSGEVVLDKIALKTDTIELAGISGTIELAELWPPATDRPQRVTIRAVEGPFGVRDIAMDLRLSAVEGRGFGRIHLDQASGASDVARLAVEQATFDIQTGEHELRLQVSELDLAQLFQLADVEGLSGTGKLSGAIPVRYGPAGLVIEPGTLAAAGPGVLRFTSDAAKQALAGGGEQVQLLLRALENFQYDSLSVRLEKVAGGAASAKLAIRGHNPEVLEGHPFAVNIDLSGNFDSLLATVLEAYGLSGQALRATVR